MIQFTILGQPCSKANSRLIVDMPIPGTDRKRPAIVKSKDAQKYEHNALKQIPPVARVELKGPVRVTLRLFYETELPDLDESIVLDVLQNRYKGKKPDRVLIQRGVYANDRQVREKHVYHGIDKANPRAEVVVEPLQAQQVDLIPPAPVVVVAKKGKKQAPVIAVEDAPW